MIKLNSLHKYFNKGRQNEIHVINDVSLELPERGMVAIFGKSGCGKTTLLNVIGGLDRFHSGKLTIEGQDICRNTDELRNRYIGYIFQNYNLHKGESCFDNVADALRLCGVTDPDEIETRVTAALTNVGMEKYSKRPPDTLSGGQQQRIAIARAIVKNPRIILADEPTGNLDEANTVMIMDLLRQIAQNHLVLLVTHEANLVDYYCDRVIELSDGCVVSVKENTNVGGYTARDKNAIYLGELHKTETSDANTTLTYYGASPETPIQLRVVNSGGKLYLKLDTAGVQILDDFSEIKLCEGTFEEKRRAEQERQIDMSALPPIEGSHFGKLFSFWSSVKSGYAANFKQRKRGKKFLRRCMSLFATVIVFMSAIFGTGISLLLDADESYNHNVFYVYTAQDGKTSQKLLAALDDPKSGIDQVSLMYGMPSGDRNIKFMTGFFETFQSASFDESFETNAAILGASLAEALPLKEGKNKDLQFEDLVITTKVADALLETSSLGYIRSYRDLLGLVTSRISVDGKNMRIAGVVESDESAIYLSDLTLACYMMRNAGLKVSRAADFDLTAEDGKALLVITNGDVKGIPSVGKSILLHGKSFEVAQHIQQYAGYEDYLAGEDIELQSRTEHGGTLAQYYKYYYSHLDDYLRQTAMFNGENIISWLYLEKGIPEMRIMLMGFEDAKYACLYELQNGREPTDEELKRFKSDSSVRHPDEIMKEYMVSYEREFYSSQRKSLYQNTYLVSDADYIALSHGTGETDTSALSYYDKSDAFYKEEYYEEVAEVSYAVSTKAIASEDVLISYSGALAYSVVHSSDPDLTDAWMTENLSDIVSPMRGEPAILRPRDIFENKLADIAEAIVYSIITICVILAIMCLCMYFIMRSSLMNRIKEVGIYRAIGVSKKNLVFKFFVEAIVLTTLTVTIGYLLSGLFIGLCLGASPLVGAIFFYPPWYALIILAILYAMCLVCGILPILSLLRKTPSEILAKYDI